MKVIWYLLRCPQGSEAKYTERCTELAAWDGLQEVVCFQYQRMMRYGSNWHLEKRMLLPGYIFLLGTETMSLKEHHKGNWENVSLLSWESPYPRKMCQSGNLIGMSRGIMRDGILMVTSGPLKGREELVRRIDRHKRIAEIEIPFGADNRRVTVGLEIYKKVQAKD